MPHKKLEFGAILAALDAAQVRYVLIGGLAMIAHGSAYVTVDVDISFARDSQNLEALSTALQTYHPALRDAPEGISFRLDSRTLKSAMNLTLSTDIGDIDLLSAPPGINSFEELWERSIVMRLYGHAVRIASIDDLIAMKEAANRPKDQMHLLELRMLKKLAENEK